MSIIKIGTYSVPDDSLTKCDVNYTKVYAAEEELENGETYTEQVRSGVPAISITVTNVKAAVKDAIMQAVSAGQFSVTYEGAGYQMRLSDRLAVSYKGAPDGVARYDLSFTLEG